MISILNRYMHGYVAMPITLLFFKYGVFEKIQKGNSISEIIESTCANSGAFKICLRMFESLGWVIRLENNRYEVAAKIPDLDNEIFDLVSCYDIPLENYLYGESGSVDKYLCDLNFSKYVDIACCFDFENDDNNFLIGSVLIPLLYLLKNHSDSSSVSVCLDNVLDENSRNICTFFHKTGLAESNNSKVVFSRLGDALWNSIKNSGVTLSYRPILSKIEQLVFGDAQRVFASVSTEQHVNRKLNVIGSGDQHGLYFESMVQYVSGFCKNSLPSNICLLDVGCGDGTFLKSCYYSLSAETIRSNKVSIAGVDLNEESLIETKDTLGDIPNYLSVGNINNPNAIIEKISKEDVDKNELLHTRAFLDHNCPLDKTLINNDVSVHLNDDTNWVNQYTDLGVYSDDDGKEISADVVVSSLSANLERWSKAVGPYGLITLEVFCMSPSTVNKYLEETENLHFDTLHGLSKQYLVTADIYLMEAAKNGLIPDKKSFRKYPRFLPYTRISMQHFMKKRFTVRNATNNDMNELYCLEELTLPENLRATKFQIQTRVSQYPEGNYVVEIGERIVGVLYTQRIDNDSLLYEMNYETIEKHHTNKGKYCQLINLQIVPQEQGTGLSQELLSFGILHNFVREGIKKIVGVSRCALYKPSEYNYLDYINKRNTLGYAVDPILRVHQTEGAEIVGVVEGYREKDIDNLGYGVHVEYDYLSWSSKA